MSLTPIHPFLTVRIYFLGELMNAGYKVMIFLKYIFYVFFEFFVISSITHVPPPTHYCMNEWYFHNLDIGFSNLPLHR
jgi:hypothetical protein